MVGPPRRRALGSIALAVIALAVGPGAARASVTFGDSLAVPPEIIVVHPACKGPCTLATTISPEHLDWFRAPLSGTIVRWRIQTVAGSSPQMLRLRLLAPVPGDELGPAPSEPFTAVGSSEPVAAPSGAGTFTFSTRVPVAAGDFLGLDAEGGLAAVAVEEESIRVFEPPLVDLGPAEAGIAQNYALLINADIAGPPHSVVTSACPSEASATVTVTADPDPAVSARALTVRVDGGETSSYALSGSRATIEVALSPGAHTLETRAEDSLGQLESAPQLTAVHCEAPRPAIVPEAPAPAPRITGLHLLRSARRTPRAIAWHDSLDARATFTLARLQGGVLRGGRCAALRGTAPVPGPRRCTRVRTVVRVSHVDGAGENHLSLGKLSLGAGRYRITGRARTAAGTSGPAASIGFVVGPG